MAQGQAGSVPRVHRLWSRAMHFKKALEAPPKEMDSLSSSGPLALCDGDLGRRGPLAKNMSFCFSCLRDGMEKLIEGEPDHFHNL